jgi:hypothetical protein
VIFSFISNDAYDNIYRDQEDEATTSALSSSNGDEPPRSGE